MDAPAITGTPVAGIARAVTANRRHTLRSTWDRSWRAHAACRGLDPSMFHPPADDEAEAEAALEVCDECPVRAACLEYALAAREDEGVWGGTTARERRRIRRRRRRSA